MAEFTLRPAVEADFDAIRQLIHQSRLNPTGLNWRRFVIVETSGGDFVGCGQIKPHSQGMLELASIAIRPEFREQGVARLLIERLLAHESDRPIYLTCRSELRDFYARFGFRALSTNEMPAYYRTLSVLANTFLFFSKSRLLVMALDSGEVLP